MNCLAIRLGVWLLTLVLFPIPQQLWAHSLRVEVFGCYENRTVLDARQSSSAAACILPRALPPLASGARAITSNWSERIIVRLLWAESREPDAWYRDDYRIARVAVGLARRGSVDPLTEASYRVLGLHPDRVWPAIVARREVALGPMYEKFWGEKLPPKKPSSGVRTNGVRPGKTHAA